ncbi:hypothetical protein ACLB2K_050646 [Fragaria x ananassa]
MISSGEESGVFIVVSYPHQTASVELIATSSINNRPAFVSSTKLLSGLQKPQIKKIFTLQTPKLLSLVFFTQSQSNSKLLFFLRYQFTSAQFESELILGSSWLDATPLCSQLFPGWNGHQVQMSNNGVVVMDLLR